MTNQSAFQSAAIVLLVLLGSSSLLSAQSGVSFSRVVATGDPVPDGGPGETFSQLWDHPAFVSDRCVAFMAEGSLGTEGIYLVRDGTVERVMDLTITVPGLSRGIGFTEINGFALDDCTVAYSAKVADTYYGVYLKTEDAPAQVVANPTTPVPGETGVNFEDAWRPWIDGDQVAFVGLSDTCLGNPEETVGIYLATPGGILRFVDTCRTLVPGGGAGEKFLFHSERTVPILEGVDLTFAAQGDAGSEGIYALLGTAPHAVADTQTAVPGGLPGELFDTDGFLELTVVSESRVSLAARGDMGSLGIFVETAGVLEMFYDLSVAPPTWLPGEVLDLTQDRPVGPWLHGEIVTFYAAGDLGSKGIYRTDGATTTPLMYKGHGFDGGVLKDLHTVPHATAERVVFTAEVSTSGGEDLTTHWGVFVASIPLFADGFESGDTSAW